MGIVASLAAAPVAHDIIEDEKRRDHEKAIEEADRLRKLREAEMYKLGDVDLNLIKRYFILIIMITLNRHDHILIVVL